MNKPHTLDFLIRDQVLQIAQNTPLPCYVVSKSVLQKSGQMMVDAAKKLPYGCEVSFAVKANPRPEIVKIFNQMNIGIDASSYFEVLLALSSGVEGKNISLTAQEFPENDQDLIDIVNQGIHINATSLHQLERFCTLFPGKNIGVRINPGIGSGYNKRLSTGGVAASFGIWYEYIQEALDIANSHNCKITCVHTHIGTGTDPQEWRNALLITLKLAENFPDIEKVNIGGGFKAKYMEDDKDADMDKIMEILAQELELFYQQNHKKLILRIEPGRLLSVHAGSIISKIIDIVDTGKNGYTFLRLNTGMTEIIRPAMYGAQHPLVVVPIKENNNETQDYIVVGHCCESSDCLTTAKGNPEEIEPRLLNKAQIGDLLVIEKTGAYCYGMSTVGYNSFPEASVIFVD